jgi:anti-anti-sigma factor
LIFLALLNLIDVRALRHAWLASKEDRIAGTGTFLATLAFGPNIQNRILTGIVIALGAFIYCHMPPRIAIVSMHPDGMLRDVRGYKMPPLHPHIGALRFDASLYFANASFFEDAVLQLEREHREIRYILIAAQGINELDTTGVETLRNLSERLRQSGVTLVLGGVKRQVLDVMQRTGLSGAIGEGNVFATDMAAIASWLAKKSVRQVAGAARNFAAGLRQRMNTTAEGAPTQPDSGKGQEGEAGAGSHSALADVPTEDSQATSPSAGLATDAPADDGATTKPPRTKQKGKVLTSTESASPLSAPA